MNEQLKKSITLQRRVELIVGDMVVSTSVKRLTNAFFYTSLGYRKVDIQVATTIIETKRGIQEFICGIRAADGRQMALKIRANKVHFDDIGTFVELNCNYDNINTEIENRLIEANNVLAL